MVLVKANNQEIISLLRQDKNKGIRLLFEGYYHLLVVYADRYLHDQQLAEDVTQEFFVRLWEDNYLLKIPASGLSAYLFTAVRNASLTTLTRKDVLRNTTALIGVEVPWEAFSSIEEEQMVRIMEEVRRLPERSRQVVECVMFKGLKYKEAAVEMNISVNTVKFLLKEVTRRLRETMNKKDWQILCLLLRKQTEK